MTEQEFKKSIAIISNPAEAKLRALNEALDTAGLTEGSSVRGAILGCIGRGSTSQDRTRAKVQATGNRWAIENFRETHN